MPTCVRSADGRGTANTRASTTSVNSPANEQAVASAVTKHRRVFNYGPRDVHTFQPTAQPLRNKKGQKGKKKVQTCTLKFYCLGHVDDEKPPSTIAAKAELVNN